MFAACLITGLAAWLLTAQVQVKVGPTFGGDGTTPFVRGTRAAGLCVQQLSGKYSEAVMRGNCYVSAVTPGTGQAPGTVIGTTAAFTLWNPTGSGKNLRVLRSTAGYVSGTMGAGVLMYAVNVGNSATSPTGGTSVTPTNALLGAKNSAVGLTGFGQTLSASPTAVEALTSMFAELATTANGFQQVVDDIDGRYVVQPGNGISLEAVAAAGTAPLITASFLWEEVTIGQE